MRNPIKYSSSEKMSFGLVPETCPAVEEALDKAFEIPSFEDVAVEAVFAKYGIELNRNIKDALYDVTSRLLFDRKVALKDVVLYQGTFPLRAALVDEIQRNNGLQQERNHFTEWIQMHQGVVRYRAAQTTTGV